jgi:short-subunit dehydrogenase
MRVELMGEGVYVSSVHPITTKTEFFETESRGSMYPSEGWGRVQTAEVVGEKIARLIERPRPDLWPAPASRWLLGMAAMLPGMTDRSMWRHLKRRKARQ